MTNLKNPAGLWLPLITPFKDGNLDPNSLRNIVGHYSGKNITGFVLAATTGEGQTLDDTELELLVLLTAEEIARQNAPIRIVLGLSGSDPRKIQNQLNTSHDWNIDGYLISCPHYLRPSQEGLLAHFNVLARSTDHPILIYNIPYRTGVNMHNETMLELACKPNIIGVKDCCGNAEQSYELLRSAEPGFSVLTGEDPFFYTALVHGASGAIVTGAHVLVDVHLEIIDALEIGDQQGALKRWNEVAHIPKLLFAEPSPAPLKHWLWRQGLIECPEVRTPMVPISDELAKVIDRAIISVAKK